MFVNINGIDVEILNFSESNYNTVESALKSSLSLPKAKNRDVIYQAFKLAVSLAPQANASDLWHHVVYRIYMEQLKATKPYKDPGSENSRGKGKKRPAPKSRSGHEQQRQQDSKLRGRNGRSCCRRHKLIHTKLLHDQAGNAHPHSGTEERQQPGEP